MNIKIEQTDKNSKIKNFKNFNISYNNNVIITISRHIENPGIVRTVYSGILRHIQGHSAIFSRVRRIQGH